MRKPNVSGSDTDCDGGMTRLTAADMDHVEMSATVDVQDLPDADVKALQTLANMYEQAFREVVAKNKGYGFSFIETGKEMADKDGGPFDNPVRAMANGLFVRTGDKRSRFFQRMFNDRDGGSNDPVYQTAIENANYWFFMALVTQYPEIVKSVGSGDEQSTLASDD